MAVPVVQAGFTSNTAVPGSSVALTKPTGLVSGDVCVILAGNDAAGNDSQWDNASNKPTGFTFIQEAGVLTGVAAKCAAFYRVIDGTESWPITVPSSGTDVNAEMWAYAIRVTGVDTAAVLNASGTVLNETTNQTDFALPATTTVNDDCLAFYLFSFDGADGDPFSVAGTGWAEQAEIEAGTGAGQSSGCWGTKDQATAGSTGTATVTASVADTGCGFTFAIKGAASGTTATVSPNSAGMSV